MEHFTRFLSWTFVFGALAALAFTSFRPLWKDVASIEINPEQVQGTVSAAPGQRPASGDEQQERIALRDCNAGESPATEGCIDRNP